MDDRLDSLPFVHFIAYLSEKAGAFHFMTLAPLEGPSTFLFVDNNDLTVHPCHYRQVIFGAPLSQLLSHFALQTIYGFSLTNIPGCSSALRIRSIVPGVDTVVFLVSKFYRKALFFKVPHKRCFAEQYFASCAVRLLCSTCYLLRSSTLHVGGPHNTPSISHHAFAPRSSSSDM